MLHQQLMMNIQTTLENLNNLKIITCNLKMQKRFQTFNFKQLFFETSHFIFETFMIYLLVLINTLVILFTMAYFMLYKLMVRNRCSNNVRFVFIFKYRIFTHVGSTWIDYMDILSTVKPRSKTTLKLRPLHY